MTKYQNLWPLFSSPAVSSSLKLHDMHAEAVPARKLTTTPLLQKVVFGQSKLALHSGVLSAEINAYNPMICKSSIRFSKITIRDEKLEMMFEVDRFFVD